MNRRIGKLITIGLFAALPLAWPASASAQDDPPPADSAANNGTLEGNKHEGINPGAPPVRADPLDTGDTRTPAQRKAGDLDQVAPPPGQTPSETPNTSDHKKDDSARPNRQLQHDDSTGSERLDSTRPQSINGANTSDPIRSRNQPQ
jgi:hypothetical protein